MEEQEWLFFEATEQRIKAWEQKEAANARAVWTGAEPPHDPQELATKRASIVQEMDYPDRLQAALQDAKLDPERRRRLEKHQAWVVETAYRTHPEILELEDRLREAHRRFTPQVAGRSLDWAGVDTLLREEADRDTREAAWHAVQPLGRELEPLMGELLGLREAWARSVTGTGFAEVACHAQELNRTEIVNLVDEVERTTRVGMAPLLERLAREAEVPDLEPWDFWYGLNQWWPLSPAAFDPGDARDAVELQMRRWGWEPTKLEITWDDSPHPGRPRSWGGPNWLSLASRTGPGPWGFDRLFRTAGSGLHRALIPESRYFWERPAPVQAEATGFWFARVLTNPGWLSEHTGAGAQHIDEAVSALRGYHVLRLRFHLAHHAFENVAYTHAGLEPTRLFQDVLEQVFQGTRERTAAWAGMRSYIEMPLSQSIPVLGAVLGAQLWEAIPGGAEEGWKDEEAGARFRAEWIEPGGREPWAEALQRVTGESPNLKGFCHELGLERFEGPQLEDSESVSDAQAEDYFKDIDLSDLDL